MVQQETETDGGINVQTEILMTDPVFNAALVLYSAQFKPGEQRLEVMLFPSLDADERLVFAVEAKIERALPRPREDVGVRRTQSYMGTPLFLVPCLAFRPSRLEFAACEAAAALLRLGIPADVRETEVSMHWWPDD